MHALGNNSNLFDESNYVTQHSDMSIITENCAKISHQLPQCWGTTSKSYVKQCYWFGTLYRGRGVNFKLTFKNSRNILLLIVWNLQKKKKKESRVLMPAVANNSSLLLWFWLCYATLWYEHNDRKLCQNNA